MRQRRLEIELLKFIAAIMVVILHVFEPGGGDTSIHLLDWQFWNPIVFYDKWILAVRKKY